MAFTINDIRSQFAGGARPTLYRIFITNPVNSIANFKTTILCQAASLPSQNLGTVNVSYFGREIVYAGDKAFEPWNITILNDEDFAVRHAFEQWNAAINSHEGNLQLLRQYKTDAVVEQLGKNGSLLRTYRFSGIFPDTISDIPLAYNATNQIEQFQVRLSYDYWVAEGPTGNIN